MNLRQFEALYWIGRLGSFHAAARHLRMSQPAISARIREMELELGVLIFDRSDRRARPTAKGLELLQYAARIVAIESEIRERVAAPNALALHRVRPGVRLRRHPSIHRAALPGLLRPVRVHRGRGCGPPALGQAAFA
jgi:DNA-binding transcriptional LysR family regulator